MCFMETPPRPDSQLSESVASEIRAVMARNGITQSTLADRVGEHPTWVSRRLSASRRQPIDLDELARLADALGVPASELISRASLAVPA